MTSPPSPPNRRRRKIIVAFVVLGLVSMVLSWWNWPRGDARFVGKWKFEKAKPPKGVIFSWRIGFERREDEFISFFANGRGKRDGEEFRWCVQGDELLMQRRPLNLNLSLIGRSEDWIRWTFDGRFAGNRPPDRHDFVFNDAGKLSLVRVYDSVRLEPMVLHRVSE